MLTSRVTDKDYSEATQHIFIALDDMKSNLPKTHEDLIERMRDYFNDQKVDVFSRIITAQGEGGFRDFIAEVVVKYGAYVRDEQGHVRLKE